MTLRRRENADLAVTTVPLGAAVLADDTTLRVWGTSTRADGSPFAPGNYVLELEADLEQIAAVGTRKVPLVDLGFPIQLEILDLSSPQRMRQFHIVEGGFYKRRDSERAREHFSALASMPGALWSDSLPLASMYADLDRHREASVVYRRILPDVVGSLRFPLGEVVRTGGHLRMAARSLAVVGDVSTATTLLRLEGRTPEAQIPQEVERLRKSTRNPAGRPK